MLSQATSSNLSEAMLRRRKHEKTFLENETSVIDRDRNKIRLNMDRHMETFLQLNRKRHETWYRYDKYFREALKKDKDRFEKRKQRNQSSTPFNMIALPSLVAINSRPEPMTKVERRTYQVLNASQKLLDESIARSKSNVNQSRPLTSASTFKSCSIATIRSSYTNTSSNFIVPMMHSMESEEYTRLMNESLRHETYSDFVDHIVKFCPEFREKFPDYHLANQRQTAVEKLRKFNQSFTKIKDQRYHNLVNSLSDFRLEKKTNMK
ncbi:unnamed protein product [Rotaria magnacalcarata]|uniref:Uncharacterized protein n=1 Tax=Rotaria magnacalcarata TaxID=392030 RepID=A0A815I3D3_9BILA|nr:unnamed protein product [Rotaria magnacalcarata]CAF1621113.1 unnamed protein product [Rotaria magnacalcarata]CAF2073719.1 unnamed protein product [Rotaria magnacalcarata]CAF2241766.1 unnamed protein product [Rotaria magnacalcarata]CAF3789625.1 unnamed protein product [Rotaria magnacalcarata]